MTCICARAPLYVISAYRDCECSAAVLDFRLNEPQCCNAPPLVHASRFQLLNQQISLRSEPSTWLQIEISRAVALMVECNYLPLMH